MRRPIPRLALPHCPQRPPQAVRRGCASVPRRGCRSIPALRPPESRVRAGPRASRPRSRGRRIPRGLIAAGSSVTAGKEADRSGPAVRLRRLHPPFPPPPQARRPEDEGIPPPPGTGPTCPPCEPTATAIVHWLSPGAPPDALCEILALPPCPVRFFSVRLDGQALARAVEDDAAPLVDIPAGRVIVQDALCRAGSWRTHKQQAGYRLVGVEGMAGTAQSGVNGGNAAQNGRQISCWAGQR